MRHFGVLDIETSKYIPKSAKKAIPTAVWLSYGYLNIYDTKTDNQTDNYFRKWSELTDILSYISTRYKDFIIYVHNLSYEGDFIFKNISKPIKLLCNKAHKIISFALEEYPNISFKCTYMLSQKSLSKLGTELGFEKLESDYRTILPHDEITEEERLYCKRDCDIVAKYIKMELKEYKRLENIPLTNTGRVRKDLKAFYKAYYGNDKPEWDLMPNEDCFQALCDAYWGAITISNPAFTNRIIENVYSFDETSEYPYTLLKNELPYTIRKVENYSKDILKKYKFWIAKISFKRVRKKYDWVWISKLKCNYYHPFTEHFNGKIEYSPEFEITLTNIDFEMIKQTYYFDSYEILEFYACDKYGKLPPPIVQLIEKYAEEKTKLKAIIEELDETHPRYLELNMDYLRVKGKLNAIYGMFVQKLVPSEYDIDENFIWHEVEKPYQQSQDKHLQRNFLFGIYCTAYARRDWLKFVLTNCPYTFIYGDTDSCKFTLPEGKTLEDIVNTNEQIEDYTEYTKDFGKFTMEKPYTRFITWGAKKYAYEHEENCNCTIAGLPKRKPNHYHSKLEDFKLGETFLDCKNAHTYIFNDIQIFFNIETLEVERIIEIGEETINFMLENDITDNGGCAIYSTFYTLSMTDNDMKRVKDYDEELDSTLLHNIDPLDLPREEWFKWLKG